MGCVGDLLVVDVKQMMGGNQWESFSDLHLDVGGVDHVFSCVLIGSITLSVPGHVFYCEETPQCPNIPTVSAFKLNVLWHFTKLCFMP